MNNMVLYKNLDKKYFHAFKENDSLRVGTLNAYRAIEGARQDVKEGLKVVAFSPEEEIHLKKDEIPTNLLPSYIKVAEVSIHLAPGSMLNLEIRIPNAYIFCVSEKPITDKFGDSYYEIIDPAMFGTMLFEKLKGTDPQIYDAHLGKVSYGGTKDFEIKIKDDLKKLENYSVNEIVLSDYFLKPSVFSHELELRYVFFTTTSNIGEFLDLTCDRKIIHNCCKFP